MNSSVTTVVSTFGVSADLRGHTVPSGIHTVKLCPKSKLASPPLTNNSCRQLLVSIFREKRDTLWIQVWPMWFQSLIFLLICVGLPIIKAAWTWRLLSNKWAAESPKNQDQVWIINHQRDLPTTFGAKKSTNLKLTEVENVKVDQLCSDQKLILTMFPLFSFA